MHAPRPLTGTLAEVIAGFEAPPDAVRARTLEVVLDGTGALLAAARRISGSSRGYCARPQNSEESRP